ncbi:hypothetical protein YS110_17690 [Acidovorax sp. YS12]|nr:hypothetical protein YS110_17690 [Acidovorax sp. YS12]
MDESTKSVAKAAEEVAKTAGKAIDAGRATGSFLAQIVKEPLTEAAGLLTDKIKYRRWENALDMQTRLDQKIAALGSRYAPRAVPMGVSVPLIEAVSLEDSGEVRELWANLALSFSNAQGGALPNKAFVAALSEMSSLDALIFNNVYSTPEADTHCILAAQLPAIVEFELPKQSETLTKPKQPSIEVGLAIANLFRLQCLQTAKYMGGPDVYSTIYTTHFGRALFDACAAPL